MTLDDLQLVLWVQGSGDPTNIYPTRLVWGKGAPSGTVIHRDGVVKFEVAFEDGTRHAWETPSNALYSRTGSEMIHAFVEALEEAKLA